MVVIGSMLIQLEFAVGKGHPRGDPKKAQSRRSGLSAKTGVTPNTRINKQQHVPVLLDCFLLSGSCHRSSISHPQVLKPEETVPLGQKKQIKCICDHA